MRLEIGIAPFVIFFVFFICKLAGVITWPWLWVTAPLWLSVSLALFLLVFFLLTEEFF